MLACLTACLGRREIKLLPEVHHSLLPANGWQYTCMRTLVFFFQNNQERTLKLNVRLVVSKRESLFLLRGFTWFFFQFTLYWSRLAVIINLVLIS